MLCFWTRRLLHLTDGGGVFRGRFVLSGDSVQSRAAARRLHRPHDRDSSGTQPTVEENQLLLVLRQRRHEVSRLAISVFSFYVISLRRGHKWGDCCHYQTSLLQKYRVNWRKECHNFRLRTEPVKLSVSFQCLDDGHHFHGKCVPSHLITVAHTMLALISVEPVVQRNGNPQFLQLWVNPIFLQEVVLLPWKFVEQN